jgi:hypothetical protein
MWRRVGLAREWCSMGRRSIEEMACMSRRPKAWRILSSIRSGAGDWMPKVELGWLGKTGSRAVACHFLTCQSSSSRRPLCT